MRQPEATAATGRSAFTPAFFFHDDVQGQTHQGTHIGGQGAVGTRDQHHVVFAGQTGHDLHHARVFGTRLLLQSFEQIDFGGAVQAGDRVVVAVQAARPGDATAGHLGAGVVPRCGNAANCVGSVHQRCHGNIVGICEGGFFAADSAHTHALVYAERAGFHNALFQTPALRAGVLKIQICIVYAVGAYGRQSLRQMALIQAVRREQQALRDGQAFEGRFVCNHSAIVEAGSQP